LSAAHGATRAADLENAYQMRALLQLDRISRRWGAVSGRPPGRWLVPDGRWGASKRKIPTVLAMASIGGRAPCPQDESVRLWAPTRMLVVKATLLIACGLLQAARNERFQATNMSRSQLNWSNYHCSVICRIVGCSRSEFVPRKPAAKSRPVHEASRLA
jgi:hypothetical protein